ncbi:MAG: polysaccharide biosynthesis/export family protein [Simkaniaceae bacterium]|nr:polysaccharide biosynthesis/export family protein [Simkaniaceae bacterium]
MRFFFRLTVFLCLCFICKSCTNPPLRGRDVYGADEFVLDSYKIREGKLSILEMEGKPIEELSPNLLEDYKDVLEDGDVLRVALFHPTRSDIVKAVEKIGESVGYGITQGKIHLPELAPVEVQGLTIDEARAKIQEQYQAEIRDMEVFLAFKDRLVRKVELAGLVSTSSIPVNGSMRLFEVLSQARLPADANLYKSYLVRNNHPLPVDMFKLLAEGDMSQNVVMRGGDKLFIAPAQASSVMVMGEVGSQGMINLSSGMMPLRNALAQAGGIAPTGNKRYIQVIRGNITRPKIYTLNWEHVIRLPTTSLLLMPGDIVYVAATPITEWNRFVTQLFPTFTIIELMTKGMSGVVAIQQ